jgi:hypothetical protein
VIFIFLVIKADGWTRFTSDMPVQYHRKFNERFNEEFKKKEKVNNYMANRRR